MLMMVLGQAVLSFKAEILAVFALASILVSISMKHRSSTNWRWPGVGAKEVLSAIGTAVLIAFFLGSAMALFPAPDPHALPWYLAGAGIGVFGVLSALKFVYLSEADFLLHCHTVDQYGQEIPRASELPPPRIVEATWKKALRGVYTAVFTLMWIIGVLSFYFFGTSFKNGSPMPTATQTEPLTDHGKTVYITPAEKNRIDVTRWISAVGFPFVLLSGLFIHFVLGVKIFGNTRTLPEYWKRKSLG